MAEHEKLCTVHPGFTWLCSYRSDHNSSRPLGRTWVMEEIDEEGNILPLDAYLCKVGWVVGQDLFSFWDYLHYFIHLRLEADLVLVATTPAIFKSDPARIHPSTVNVHMCPPVVKLWEVIERGRDKVVLLFLACGDIISKLGLNQQGQTCGSGCCWDHLGWVSRAATAVRTPFAVLVIIRNEARP